LENFCSFSLFSLDFGEKLSSNGLVLFIIIFCCFFLEIGSLYVAQVGLRLIILLLQPLEFWDYRNVLP
jgi:uncharacterized membrane protein YgaE (UPF0421/DUF939 family)